MGKKLAILGLGFSSASFATMALNATFGERAFWPSVSLCVLYTLVSVALFISCKCDDHKVQPPGR